MSLHNVTIIARRKAGAYENEWFAWKVQAEIDFPAEPEDRALIKGHFVNLTATRLAAIPRMRDVFLQINAQRYKLLSVQADGSFVILKDVAK
ncbi:MAG TPA: hypothetical protein VK335_08390 [Bryobacteraceae bacterium]|nr:hypothetical protein [Bryobacteraceae bacterium]HXR15924.1 hypothetical protein [Terriglobales bacterium]HZW96130.1 hypothetical protein [Candidatus Eremiobacteraceae bacterium]